MKDRHTPGHLTAGAFVFIAGVVGYGDSRHLNAFVAHHILPFFFQTELLQ